MIASEIIDIQVSDYNAKYLICLDFYINYFLHYLFVADELFILLFHLNFNEKLKVLLKIVNYNKLIKSLDKIKFCQDRLKLLNIKCPVLGIS